MKNFVKYLDWIILVFVIFTFFRTCGAGSDITRMKKDIEVLKQETLVNREENITKEEMIEIIKNTPNWRTLEIEELSDKNRVPINYFKNDEERDSQ